MVLFALCMIMMILSDIIHAQLAMTKLSPPDGADGDKFGYALSIHGETAIMGSRSDDNSIGSAYIFERQSFGNWSFSQKLVASDGNTDDNFGVTVSLYGGTAIIGAHNGNSAYIFEKQIDGTWAETQILTGSDTASGDNFGWSVSIYEDTAVIGARFHDDNGGAVYIFNKQANGLWVQGQKLNASDALGDDLFGYIVAIYNDTIAVNTDGTDLVYIFERESDNGTWIETSILNSTAFQFGRAVSVYDDTIVIGASPENAAFVYTKTDGNIWQLNQTLTASDSVSGDGFAFIVTIYNQTIVIGAWADDDKGTQSGSAYIFNKASSGEWIETAKITENAGDAYNYFGRSVSIYGEDILIGAYRAEDESGSETGTAYIMKNWDSCNQIRDESYLISPTNTYLLNWQWTSCNFTASPTQVTQQPTGQPSVNPTIPTDDPTVDPTADPTADPTVDPTVDPTADPTVDPTQQPTAKLPNPVMTKLSPPDGADGDKFGYALSIYGDTAVIGSRSDNNSTGSAYIFERQSIGNWSFIQKIVASDGNKEDNFGLTVSLYGGTAIIGAHNGNSAYIFEKQIDGTWIEIQKLTGSDTVSGDNFGWSVSIYEDTAVIGARFHDDDGGAVYIFNKQANGLWVQGQKLNVSDARGGDLFGYIVDIYNDTIVVNADGTDLVYIFERESDSGTWIETAVLNSTAFQFGRAVSVYDDTVVIGASPENEAFVYTKTDDNLWQLNQTLYGSDTASGDGFAFIVSIYDETIVIGAWADDDKGSQSGSAYIFNKVSGGEWIETAKITENNGSAYNYFGRSASIYDDDILIGAYRADDESGDEIGTAYVMKNWNSCNQIWDDSLIDTTGRYLVNWQWTDCSFTALPTQQPTEPSDAPSYSPSKSPTIEETEDLAGTDGVDASTLSISLTAILCAIGRLL